MKTIQFKYATLIVVGVLLIVFYLGWHFATSKERSSQTIRENAYKSEINRITVELDHKTLYLASVNQEIETLREAKQAGDLTTKELRAFNLKTVNELTRLKLRIDTLLRGVTHDGRIDTVYIDNVPRPVIELPFEFHKKDLWLELSGSFDRIGDLDISLKMDADVDVWTGISKETKQPIATVTSNSRYIGTLNVNSVKLDTPKDRKYSVSLFVGYGVCKTGLSPVIGLGVGRSIFKF